MTDRHYPRIGCAFCLINRDKLEQVMKHLDEHISELMDAKMKSRRPAGDHALDLIRAVRRGSERKGVNALIKLDPTDFDDCRNWRLYEELADEAEYLRFMHRKCRAQKEWLELATMFLESEEAEKFTGKDKASKNTYKPDWSMLDEDDEDADDDEEQIARKYVEAAKAKKAARKAKPVAAATTSVHGNKLSPIKPKGSGCSIGSFCGVNKVSRKAQVGKARMEKYVADLGDRENDFNVAGKNQDNQKSNRITNTAKENGQAKEKRAHPDLIDLITPVKAARMHSPSTDDDDDDEAFDINTPKHDKTTTLFVKCFDDNGLYEIDAGCALETAIRMVEDRMKGIRVKCFRSEGKKVTARMWEKMVSKVLVVTADWEFDDDVE